MMAEGFWLDPNIILWMLRIAVLSAAVALIAGVVQLFWHVARTHKWN